MPVSDAQKRASAKYNREKVTQKVVRFYPADADILRHAERQGAFATYVKRLIREDMERKA
ncbi:hypothetical protein ACTQY8_05470 [Collinsella bouchesdurhonensis]|jgi:hypothetical protein|uniref:hypothetical protein n=1 Tax=Collinsella bouchesdurhonensis TaxID=1907654 RepID=UPI0020459624|nr:MAG TPA: hypothetical protein [Caudoviricetes sp.]